jgi:hypothetical protein
MTWQELQALRDRGQKPALLCVTPDFRRCADRAKEGAMVVVHKAGEQLPVELLDGLNVELYLDDCSQTFRLAKAWKGREIQPALCSAWCHCEGRMTVSVSPDCGHAAQCARDWS